MPLSTKAIFGKRVLSQLSAGDYIEWAGEMLVQGFDSHHLRILAGLDNSTSVFEAEERFLRCSTELEITAPDPETAIRAYACEIAQQLIAGRLTGREGVRALYQICRATEYDPDFLIWYDLDDAFDHLRAGDYPYTYPSATLENYNEVAKQEAEKFIADMSSRFAI